MNRPFLRLLKYGLSYRRLLTQAVLLLIIATAGNVLGPYLIKVFIDQHLTPADWTVGPIVGLVLAYITAQLISAVTFFQQAIRFNEIALNVVQMSSQWWCRTVFAWSVF